jgi:GMP synthase (glutamine-hydrolysing)
MPEHRKNCFRYLFDSINTDIHLFYVEFDNLSEKKTLNSVMNADGVILTGSELNLSDYDAQKKMKNVLYVIRNYKKPVLGICFGHQLIAHAFGFQVDYMEDRNSEWERVINLEINTPYDLIKGNSTYVEVTHQQEIKYTPEFEKYFQIFSSSQNCRIHLIKHRILPIYGVQGHPETNKSTKARQNGLELFKNFVSLL